MVEHIFGKDEEWVQFPYMAYMIKIIILFIFIIQTSGCSSIYRLSDIYNNFPVKPIGFRIKNTDKSEVKWIIMFEFNFGTNYEKRKIIFFSLEKEDYGKEAYRH